MAGSYSRGPIGREPEFLASRTPGSLGILDAGDPNQNMCLMGDTPGPVGVNDFADVTEKQLRSVRTCTIVPFDLGRLDRLFRSYGVAKAVAETTKLEWKTYDESTLLNVIYWLVPGKGTPGWVEVSTADQEKINAAADKEALHLAEVFLSKKCKDGPTAALKYLEFVASQRQAYIDIAKQVFADAGKINQEIVSETENFVTILKRVKAGSELFLAPASLVSAPAAAVWLGYELTVAFAENWEKGMGATAVAVGKEVAEETAEKAGEKASEAAERRILAGGKQADRVKQLRQLVDKYTLQMEGKKAKKLAKLQTRVNGRLKDIAKIQKTAARSARNVFGKALGRLNFVFVAKDMAESWNDLMGTFEE